MIFKASKRSGSRQLGSHLLKTEENEHVEIHEVSGFISDTVMGAMNEAYAAARGTKCKQYLFSMSLSPPAHESVRVEVFEKVIGDIEDRLGLTGQPRVIVFHEKEGRRHATPMSVQRALSPSPVTLNKRWLGRFEFVSDISVLLGFHRRTIPSASWGDS